VITADTVAVDQQRVKALSPQTRRPLERGCEIGKGDLAGIDDVLVVKVDIDSEPLRGLVVADRVQPDQVRNGSAGEVAFQFVQRHHVSTGAAPFLDRQHYDADLAVPQRILAPHVAAVDEVLHRPLGKLAAVPLPFFGDPKQTLVACKFYDRLGHQFAFSHPPTNDLSARFSNNRRAPFSELAMRMSRSSGFSLFGLKSVR
jgi:hypothetical protein